MIENVKKRTRKENINKAYTYGKTRKRTAATGAAPTPADADHDFEEVVPTRGAKAKRQKTAPPPKKQTAPPSKKQTAPPPKKQETKQHQDHNQQKMTILDFMEPDVKDKFQRLKKQDHT